MNRFITRIACFLLLLVMTFVLIACLFPPKPTYISEFRHKSVLLHSTQSPRLIFIGGSNLAFGLDSKTIQDSLKINIVNAGLHAGLGLKSMLDTTEPYLRKGDYVILVPEYSHFYDIFEGDEKLADLTLREGWPLVKTFNFVQLCNMLKFLPQVIINNALVNLKHCDQSSQLDSPNGFNEFGDFIEHWDRPRQDISKIKIKIKSEFDSNAADYLVNKIKLWRSMGITVNLLPPIIINDYYINEQAKIDTLCVELEKRGIGFLVDPKRYVLPDTMAFDTPYHMSIYGVKENTKRIIEDLRSVLH